MSMRDQLLKAGLVDEKKLKEVKKAKHQQTKSRKGKNKGGAVDEARLAAEKARAEKVERDRQLNLQHKQEAEQRAIAAQVRQIVEMNRQEKGAGDIAYNFTDGAKVARLYVTEQQQKQLGNGRLCIVKFDGVYELIPTSAAEKIRQRDTAITILSNQPTEQPDGDDPYADYKVPDDLMW